MNTELPIIQYWHSPDVPADVAELIASVERQNPDLRHLLFDEAKADSFIAEHLTERELAAFRACAVPAMQADYFRYCAVYTLGGLYVDADFRCMRPFRRLLEETDEGVLFRRVNGAIDNGFFAFTTRRHRLLRLVLDLVTANIEQRAAEEIWWVTGPGTFTALAELHCRGSFQAAREAAAGRGFEQRVQPLLDSIGKHERVTEAFEGVRIASFDPETDCVEMTDPPPSYKQKELHWVNWQERGATIFR